VEAAFLGKVSCTFTPGLPLAYLFFQVDIDKHRGRLSKVLLAHIASELPSPVSAIDWRVKFCRIRQGKLVSPRPASTNSWAMIYVCCVAVGVFLINMTRVGSSAAARSSLPKTYVESQGKVRVALPYERATELGNGMIRTLGLSDQAGNFYGQQTFGFLPEKQPCSPAHVSALCLPPCFHEHREFVLVSEGFPVGSLGGYE
jgi:hypothetical protein